MTCDAGTEMVPFSGETHRVDYRGATAEVEGLSGFRCPVCGEVEYDADSAERYAAAGDTLVLAARRAAGDELLALVRPDDLRDVFVRSQKGDMIPLTALATIEKTTGPEVMERFNVFPAAKIMGQPATGHTADHFAPVVEHT